MLNAKKPSDVDIDNFYSMVCTVLTTKIDAIDQGSILNTCKTFLKSQLKEIVTSKPEKLLELNGALLKLCNISNEQLEHFRLNRRKKQKPLNKNVKDAVRKCKKLNNALAGIFDYDSIISSNKQHSYALAKINGTNACIYCNRQYTLTIYKKNDKSKGITRPQFDHYFPKFLFPMLGLSYYNLIPSCYICNSPSFKGEKLMLPETHLHPYIDEKDIEFTFVYKYDQAQDNFEINISNPAANDKITKTFEDFRTQELYQSHANMELRDLHNLKYKYPTTHTNVLVGLFNSNELDRNKIYQILFGIETNPKIFYNRPFSKFKFDILEQLRTEI